MTNFSAMREISEGVFVDDSGEIHHNGPMPIQQNYDKYTAEEHGTWKILYERQRENLEDIAYRPWLEAIDTIKLSPDRLPKLIEVTETLQPMTGWVSVPVHGFLPIRDYFEYLSKRQFPTVAMIRPREKLEFIAEPDLFHDAFGHLPMHTHSAFADFLELFGRTALKAETEEQMTGMQRLYWFTVEYCLIHEEGKIKVCGSGHMSGIEESRYSLTDAVEKKPFDLETVCAQDYNPHILQPLMFVIESYEQLYEAMYKKAAEWGVEADSAGSLSM